MADKFVNVHTNAGGVMSIGRSLFKLQNIALQTVHYVKGTSVSESLLSSGVVLKSSEIGRVSPRNTNRL